jgi:hypothetical protein
MFSLVDQLPAEVLTGLLLIGCLMMLRLGHWLRRRQGRPGETLYATAATVSLLTLLIGFTFSVALNRYDTRRDMVVEEAAAGFALWQRIALQPEPTRTAMAKTMEAYVAERLRYFSEGTQTDRARPTDFEADMLMERMWDLMRAAGNDGALVRIMTDSLTRVDDVAWRREAIAREHIPLTVIDALGIFLLLTALSLGYSGNPEARVARLPHLVFLAMAIGAIAVVLDLDRPRTGLVRVSQAPMLELAEDIRRDMADEEAR